MINLKLNKQMLLSLFVVAAAITSVLYLRTGGSADSDLLSGIEHTVVVQSEGEKCEVSIYEDCFLFGTKVVALDQSSAEGYLSLAKNIERGGWTSEDESTSVFIQQPQESLDNADANSVDERAEYIMTLLGGGLFGQYNFFATGDARLYVGVQRYPSDRSENDIRHSIQTTFPVSDAAADQIYEFMIDNQDKLLIGLSESDTPVAPPESN